MNLSILAQVVDILAEYGAIVINSAGDEVLELQTKRQITAVDNTEEDEEREE